MSTASRTIRKPLPLGRKWTADDAAVCENNPATGWQRQAESSELADGAVRLRSHRQAGACRCHPAQCPEICTDTDASSHRARSTRGRGLTLVEVVVATAVVALMLVAALNTLGASARGYLVARRAQQGFVLAEELMAEIMQGWYEDPDGSPLFGLETGDTGTGRLGYDDVDDYHGLSEYPPLARNGTPVPGADGWTRQVAITWVDPLNPSTTVASESGLKKIAVAVTNAGGVKFKLVALRSSSGMMELQPPVDCNYVVGLEARLQVGTQVSSDSDGTAIGNHTSGD